MSCVYDCFRFFQELQNRYVVSSNKNNGLILDEKIDPSKKDKAIWDVNLSAPILQYLSFLDVSFFNQELAIK